VEVFGDGINKVETMDMMLATRISSALVKHYPGHYWAVNVNSDGGVVDIKALNISLSYGFRLMLKDVQNDPTYKLAIMGAGEILERAHMRVGGRRDNETAQKIDDIPDKYQPTPGGILV